MSNVQGPSDQPLFDPSAVRGNRKIYSVESAPGTNPIDSDEIVWSHGGFVNPTASETGPPWPAPNNLTIVTLYLTLAAASNVNLSVGTYRNGVLLATSTITAGNLVQAFALGFAFTTGQTLQPVLAAAATGTGVSLGVIYRYTRA